MLEEKEYRAVGMIFTVVCEFLNHVAGCTKPPEVNKVHAMYSLLMIRASTPN